MTNSLDSLAKIASGLGLSPRELAAELTVTIETVEAWITGTARPAEEARASLERRVLTKLISFNGAPMSVRRVAILNDLMVALQTPAERKLWLAKRRDERARRAR